jgi:hypothetical protein
MRASVGDNLTVKALHQGESDRHGTIVEVRGKNGEPPYLVRWQDEHESVFFPAAGTVVDHRPATGQPAAN